MIKKIVVFLAVVLMAPRVFSAAELRAIKFKQKGEVSLLELSFDRDHVIASRFHVTEDKQIILDVKDVKSTDRIMRSMDTSEFSGSIVFVSSYKRPGSDSDIRIAIQLRDNVRSRIVRRPNKVILEVENRFGVFAIGGDGNNKVKVKADGKTSVVEYKKVNTPKSNSLEDILQNLTMSGQKRYIGKKITLNVKDMKVENVLKIIAEASGFNIILRNDVKALTPLTLNLTNLPWDQVLDTILGLNNLVVEKNGIILTVQTENSARDIARRKQESEKLKESKEKLITKIFPISYAKLDSLRAILRDYITRGRGKITLDKRTKSLIIRDSRKTLDKIKGIIEALDTQPPQVLIESKIVEVSAKHSKEIGLRDGVKFGYDPVGDPGNDPQGKVGPQGSAAATGADGGPGFAFSSAPGLGKQFIALGVGKFSRLFNLNFKLQLLENETKAKVISSPKVITQDNTKASLVTRETDAYAVQEVSDTTTKTSFVEQAATIQLDVTPQITNEGSILLDISLKRDDFGDRAVKDGPKRKLSNDLKTNVLVDNGATVVLGGIYTYRSELTVSGIPFLKEIPIIGWLFKSLYNPSNSKRELIMFITPRIINQSEAGLSG